MNKKLSRKRKQVVVVLLLLVTVVAPILLFTDTLINNTTNALFLNSFYTTTTFTTGGSDTNDFAAAQDVTTIKLGIGEARRLNLLHQEPSKTLKEPGIIISEKESFTSNTTLKFAEYAEDDDASTDSNSSRRFRQLAQESVVTVSTASEIGDRRGSSEHEENPIKQVTQVLGLQTSHSGITSQGGSTNNNSLSSKEETQIISKDKKGKDMALPLQTSNNSTTKLEKYRGEQSGKSPIKDGNGEPRKTKVERGKEQPTVMPDARVRQLKDQLIQAKVYLSLAATRSNAHFTRELRLRVKEVQRALGEANKDSDLPRNWYEKVKAMELTLAKGKQIQDECTAMVKKLRAMIHSTEEQLRVHKKQTLFLTHLTAKTLPKGLHCLPLRLSNEYFSLNTTTSEMNFPNQNKLEDTSLYHYALFTDNVLAAAVVVNSTISHAKDPSNHVFHIVTDRLNYAAMRMWFLANLPGKATIQVQTIQEFTWLNSSYSPVLKQLGSPSMVDYYFKIRRADSDSNMKYRNPKYLSIMNHLRFYMPEIFPKLNKVLFLDDDVVVQKDLTALWSLDLKGKVIGVVETCGESFHRFDRYLNFSNPLIAKNFNPRACGWAFGMNMFDLEEWKSQNITGVYHSWQNLNHDRQLWKLGTLPPGLITFHNRTYPLDRLWHVLGLGYNPNVGQKEIEQAAVIHYNGNLKPWLEIGIPKYKSYWSRYVDYDHLYLRECNINP